MKSLKLFALLATTWFFSTALGARELNLKALSCSGLGITNGYTTIQYLGDSKVSISSLKYFIQSSDVATVVQSRIDKSSGDLTLQFVTKNHGSSFLLKLYKGSSRGDLITASGTDILTCTSLVSPN